MNSKCLVGFDCFDSFSAGGFVSDVGETAGLALGSLDFAGARYPAKEIDLPPMLTVPVASFFFWRLFGRSSLYSEAIVCADSTGTAQKVLFVKFYSE